MMTPVDYSPPRKTSRLQKNEAPRYNAKFRTQDPTRFSVQEQSSLNTRIVNSGIRHFNYIINDVNFTSQKNGSRTSPLSKRIFEHDRQHVNNVTRAVISESEDFEREKKPSVTETQKLFSELQQYFSLFRFREERRIFSFSSPTVRHRRMDPRSRFHFRRQETQRFRPHPEYRNTKKNQPSQHLRCLKTAIVRSIMDFLLLFD